MSAPDTESSHVRLPTEIQDLVYEEKLTIHAGWLYGLLLRHLNYKRGDAHVWPSRSNLAKRMRFKNARAVDRYLDELAEAGLIEKERRRKGEVNDTNRYTLLLVSWPKEHSGGSEPQHTTPSGLENTTLVRHSTPELDGRQLDEGELEERSDQSGSPSGRSAPSGAGEREIEHDDPWSAPAARQPSTGERLTRKREDDRALFASLIEAHRLRSDGSTFREGVFDTHLFYDGFRKVKIGEKKIGFPGAYIESMCAEGYGRGVEDWLLSVGLEPV
ncbi:hypothetical protein ABT336_11930 [Micromonospora sp. NPDC000207]|uniref:hypothetical protein n=1 Tax=Micromonospora sp. NPDC000207 TaxID=3154246 RepID=UPI00331D6247